MDTPKNSKSQYAKSASKAGRSRVYDKIPRQPAQVLSALAMGQLVTGCFTTTSLKSVPFPPTPYLSLRVYRSNEAHEATGLHRNHGRQLPDGEAEPRPDHGGAAGSDTRGVGPPVK